eukprot:TRINITY_DN19528_c0_g3_i1.p1 TRINITY_DN19528_c0_g3~~TRINITY_DN19528_c0_g3_i1.p1  ORF type:complete len:1222 (+),score=101.94 TRINITY_DN19528_c0_g3_i1:38-3703(+)
MSGDASNWYFCCATPVSTVQNACTPPANAGEQKPERSREPKETQDEICLEGALSGWEGGKDEAVAAPSADVEATDAQAPEPTSPSSAKRNSGGLLPRALSKSWGLWRASSFHSNVSSGPSYSTKTFGNLSPMDRYETAVPDAHDRRIIFQPSMPCTVDPPTANIVPGGKPNFVMSAKFTPLTWLPKSLFHQFRRVANVYFLLIAVLVLIGTANGWSPKDWKSKIGPFVFVLMWTAFKDLYEDSRRHADDKAVNSQKCFRYNHDLDCLEEICWSDVLVGDIIFLPEDSAFPADLFLLSICGGASTGATAYISTVMLDGETNLKERACPSLCSGIMLNETVQHTNSFTGSVKNPAVSAFCRRAVETKMSLSVAGPVAVLSDVRGCIEIESPALADARIACPLNEEHLLPRGCVLRATPWALGVVAYCGKETKVCLNTTDPGAKFSNMQVNLNSCVQGLLVFISVVCLYATVRSAIIGETPHNFLVSFCIFCIALYHVVPMSLYVVYEMLKLIIGFQVNIDKNMQDPETRDYALARTADLMEELGQIDFIFSDKTGTLTKNDMVFARCHMDGINLGDFRPSTDRAGLSRVKEILSSPDNRYFGRVFQMFTCLAVCHDVQAKKPDEDFEVDSLVYQGSSPDEVALVNIARDCGIAYTGSRRRPGSSKSDIIIKGPGDHRKKYVVLARLPFSSDRKRMSIILRNGSTIWCITKGADTTMEGLLCEPFSQSTTDHILQYSSQGLRVLVIAFKEVPVAEFEEWDKDYRAANNVVDSSREEQMAKLAAKMETGLNFCGLTAVEDRLQDGVPEAIETLKKAGIRMWVLTGDKIETAVDIARSCSLFDPAASVIFATGADTLSATQALLESTRDKLEKGVGNEGLVFDGRTLQFGLEDPACRKLLFECGTKCRGTICARMSPMQKLLVVQLAAEQDRKSITLAIGDGANDVPMISAAHVGVSVRGREGTQAVSASDIAISQFRFLVPLLFCHGRSAYRKVSVFLCFYFYKNMVLLMADLIWMHQNMFNGSIAMPEYLSIGFNAFFTSWHILFVIGFDEDMSYDVAVSTPEFYTPGPQRALFNKKVFGSWLLLAAYHGSVAWLIPNLWFADDRSDKSAPSAYWVASATAFTNINLIVCIKLVLVSTSPGSKTTVLPTITTLILYIICLFMLGNTGLGNSFQPCMADIPLRIFVADEWTGNKPLLAIIIAVPVALIVDVIIKVIRFATRNVSK